MTLTLEAPYTVYRLGMSLKEYNKNIVVFFLLGFGCPLPSRGEESALSH